MTLARRSRGDAKVDDILQDFAAPLATCREKARDAKIILTGILPRNDNPAVLPEIARVNGGLAGRADGERIFYLNVNDKLAGPGGTSFERLTNGKLHLTEKGYYVSADGLRPQMLKLLGSPATTDHAPPGDDPAASRPVAGS